MLIHNNNSYTLLSICNQEIKKRRQGYFVYPFSSSCSRGFAPLAREMGVGKPAARACPHPFPLRATSLLVARGTDTKCNTGKRKRDEAAPQRRA